MPVAGVVPAGGQVVYTGVTVDPNTLSETGLYASQDGGRHWQPKDQGIVSGHLRYDVLAQLLPDGRRHLLTVAPISDLNFGVFRSDGGNAWGRLPLRADEIISAGGPKLVATAMRGVVRSEDGGDSWTAAAPAPPGASGLISDLHQPRYLAVRSHEGEEGGGDAFLWTSDDGGASWRLASEGLPAACGHVAGTDYCPAFWTYVVDPFDAKRRWVASYESFLADDELFVSHDAGASWQSVPAGLPAWIFDVAADPTVHDRLLAGTISGLWVSEDGGAHWSRLGKGLPQPTGSANVGVGRLIRDSRDGTWYAVAVDYATFHSGIYRSLDGGASWTRLAGAPDNSVAQIRLDPKSPNALLAVFPGQGLWRWTP